MIVKEISNLELYNYIMDITEDLMTKTSGKIAYILSYNIRKMQEELTEYIKVRNELIHKYSTELPSGQYGIDINSPTYKTFLEEMKVYDEIKHTISLLQICPMELYDTNLNADEILRLSFMIEEYDPTKENEK